MVVGNMNLMKFPANMSADEFRHNRICSPKENPRAPRRSTQTVWSFLSSAKITSRGKWAVLAGVETAGIE